MIELTQSRLQELLHYNRETGDFTWLPTRSRTAKAGAVAGTLSTKAGYRYIRVGGKAYLAHRLAFFYMTGAWPVHQMDHYNGIRDDNRWGNLREATNAENQQNQAMHSNNTSGFMGVSWHRQTEKWRAQIKVAGRRKSLGLFTTPESAHAAYLTAKAEHHPFQPHLRSKE